MTGNLWLAATILTFTATIYAVVASAMVSVWLVPAVLIGGGVAAGLMAWKAVNS